MDRDETIVAAYDEMLSQIRHLYDVACESEHRFIHEFFEGQLPVFKLILVDNTDGPGFIMVSFHIEMEASAAIQWFMRIRQMDPNLRVTQCYLKDQNGVSYVGEDAQVLRLYVIEQEIMSSYIQGDKDADEIITQTVTSDKPSPVRTYSDQKTTIDAFNKLKKSKGDFEH